MSDNRRRAFKDAAAFMAEAQALSGLSDFGPESFREGLERYLDGVRGLALSDASEAVINGNILRWLTNRLDVEAWHGAHPEAVAAPVEAPVSIFGLPRTGTTALTTMLSLDDDFRTTRMWEQKQPCPPPMLGEEAADPRRLALVDHINRLSQTNPEMTAMHIFDADAGEEDIEILSIDFKTQHLGMPIFEYHRWWRDADLRPTFAYHRRVIQLLQSQRPPNRWMFKAPAHSFHLEAIVEAYPDMRFVMTHRDPTNAVPSGISFLAALSPPGSIPAGDLKAFGRHHAEHLRISMERAIEARRRLGEDRFLDIHHRVFLADPFGTIDRVYAWLGRELRPHIRAKMVEWHAANRSGSHGLHRYSAEDYGLTKDRLRAEFDFYVRRFDIAADG